MANKKKKGGSGAARQQQREFEAKARAREEKQQQERAEIAQKNARLGSIFLYGILSVVAVFCLYTLIRTLLGSAASVSELRDNWLFVSLVSIPYLILTAAVVIRKLRKKRREEADKRSRRVALFLFLLIVAIAAGTFFFQLYRGRTDASRNSVYTQTVAALEQTGETVTGPEEVPAFRSLLEYSLEAELRCGQTQVLLNYHAGSSFIAGQFVRQVLKDYADFTVQTTVWEDGTSVLRINPASGSGSMRGLLSLHSGDSVKIWELTGPEAEVNAILDALENRLKPES